jgi:Divergent InlB B-repeat domain
LAPRIFKQGVCMRYIKGLAASVALAAMAALSACGGGGGGSTPPQTPPDNGTRFTLRVDISGAGSISSSPAGINNCAGPGSCSGDFNQGSTVELTATPAADQNFAGWGGACSGTQNSCSVLMSEARNVTAAFTPNDGSSFALNISLSGQGSVASSPAGIDCGADCSELFAANTQVTLTATPAAGQLFSAWTGDCAGSGAVCSLQMSANRSAQAVFVAPNTAGWGPQTLVSQPGVGGFGIARTAMAPDGSAMTTWVQAIRVQGVLTDYALWSSRYTPSSGWSAPVQATRLGLSFNDLSPVFAMSANGEAIYAWRNNASNAEPHFVYALSYAPSTGWSGTRTLNTINQPVFELSAGLDDSGRGFVAWSQFQEAPKQFEVGIWANRFGNGSWGTAQLINTDGRAADGVVNLAVMPNGNALAVWNGSSDSRGDGYHAALFSQGSLAWASPVIAVPNSGTDNFSLDFRPSLAASNAGAVLSWSQREVFSGPPIRFEVNVMSLRFSGGAWETTPRPVGNPVVATEFVRTQAAINAQGQAAVGWQDPADTRLWVNRSQTSGAWGTPEIINGGLLADSELFQLGVADNGNVLAAWYQSQGLQNTNVFTSRYSSAGWSAPEAMMNYDPSRGIWGQHVLATNARGDAVLTYVLALDVFNLGSQIFSRYFVASP